LRHGWLPTLERDARAISEQARLRGLDLRAGWWGARAAEPRRWRCR